MVLVESLVAAFLNLMSAPGQERHFRATPAMSPMPPTTEVGAARETDAQCQ